MKKSLIFLASAALLCGFSLTAQDYNWDKPNRATLQVECRLSGEKDPKVAMDPILSGEKGPVNCTIVNKKAGLGAANKEEMRAFNLHVLSTKLKENEWTTITFSFRVRSRRKGRISIMIQGWQNWCVKPKELPNLAFFGIAQISSPQITFPNGGNFVTPDLKPWGFRERKIKDKDTGEEKGYWNFTDPETEKKIKPVIETDDRLDTPGKKYMITRTALHYTFDAKPGQEITISLKVKPAGFYVPLH